MAISLFTCITCYYILYTLQIVYIYATFVNGYLQLIYEPNGFE